MERADLGDQRLPQQRRRERRDHGWAVGDDGAAGVILATSDGGATWGPQIAGTTEYLYGVAFRSANQGWAVGTGGTILVTTNGGGAWNAQDSGATTNLNAVVFSDATHGWAVGDEGTILATVSGGFPPVTPTVTSFLRLRERRALP